MSCACISPFFNEYDRILKVLDEVLKVKLIDEIILVDDRSTKICFIKGLKKSLLMNNNILGYLGFQGYCRQVLFFCRKNLV